jgi:hypothetical protein
MRTSKLLQSLLVAGVALTAGTSVAFAQASGTTGDLNAPAGQKSSSDTQEAQPPAGGTGSGDGMSMPMDDKAGGHAAMKGHPATRKHMAMSGHKGGKMAHSGRNACFPLAMQFDKKASMMVSSNATSPKLMQATEARNKAMESCNAGRINEGQAALRQAMAGL